MTPEIWNRLKELFGEATEADAAELPAILARADAEGGEIGAKLRELLRENGRDVLNTAMMWRAAAAESPQARQVGPYRLLRELGRGGTSTVYLAEREDDEFHRPVALKILRQTLLEKDVQKSFLQERRALAQLRHPHITALLDWGIGANEMPWLAVEYVEGQPIDAYCREKNLSAREIVELFRQLCLAIEFAHRHLIIHRDIKPANVLVNGEGFVKLLDFGISRLLEGAVTGTVERRFTPAYASPEHIEGRPMSAATDVYSLGLVLYELLTGSAAFSGDTMGAVLRKVLHEPAVAPSRAPDTKAEVRRAIASDVDRIVLHAIDKDPEQRYASVEQFRRDLERWRDGFPISLAPPGAGYELRKFVQRHRVAVAVGTAAVMLLAGTAAVAVVKAGQAQREKAAAERRFKDLQGLAHAVIFDLHDKIRSIPGSVSARQLLVATALKYLDGVRAERSDDDVLQMELANGYYRIAYAQGGFVGMNLGDAEGGRKSFQTALAILDGLWKRHPDDPKIGTLLFAVAFNTALTRNDPADGVVLASQYAVQADAWVTRKRTQATLHAAGLLHQTIGRTSRSAGRLDSAMEHLDRAIAYFTELDGIALEKPILTMVEANVGKDQSRHMLAITQAMRSQVFTDMGRTEEAAGAALESQKFEKLAMDLDPASPAGWRALAVSHGYLSTALLEGGHIAEAIREAELELEASDALRRKDDANVTFRRDRAQAWRHLGVALIRSGQAAKAVPMLRDAADEMKKIGDADPAFLYNRLLEAGTLNDLGAAERRAGFGAAARASFTKAAELADDGLRKAPGWTEFLRERALAEEGLEDSSRAQADWREFRARSRLHRRDRGR